MSDRASQPVVPARWRSRALVMLVLIAGLSALGLWAQSSAPKLPPATRVQAVREMIHGVEIVDPYRWLEDRKSPETEAWIEAQSEYTHSLLNSLPGRQALRQRLTDLLAIDSWSLPIERNETYFFLKRKAAQELPILYTRRGLHGEDEVLVDPHPLSRDHSISVSLANVSEDGALLAYGLRHGGEDEIALHLMDVRTRKDLPDTFPKARYFGISLKPDKSGLFYSRQNPEGSRVYYHALGSDRASDVEVFGNGFGPDKIIVSSVSEGGHYLVVHVFHGSAAEKTEVYFQDLERGGGIVPIVNDLPARFIGEVGGDRLFLHTDWEAPNGRLLAVDLRHPDRSLWKELVPETDAVIDGFSLAGGKLFVNTLKNVQSSLKVFDPDGRLVRELPLPSTGSVSGVEGRWSGRHAFYAFTSFAKPRTIHHCEVSEGSQEVWANPKPSAHGEDFEIRQVWVTSSDGTKFPMFLMHSRHFKPDGSSPALLTGYGGFDASETPAYSARAVLWVERGGVYALANLRGGGEFGESWHRAGMREKKQNVFDDFIAAAEWLVGNHYTQPARLAIFGRSNGGLLVGAAITQRPDLFGAAICGYPLLDMIRYQKFLVARFWVSEYGTSDDPDQFKYLLAYSPYQHVNPGVEYPAVLFFTGDGDTRVDPLHARKMCARLQAAGSKRPVILHYDTRAGHTSAEPLSQQVEDLTDELSFLFWQLREPAATTRDGLRPDSSPATAGSE